MLSRSMQRALNRLKEEDEHAPGKWHYASMLWELPKTLDALVKRGFVEVTQIALVANPTKFQPQAYSTQYRIKQG